MLYHSTFSIVAHNPADSAWGIAVASKFPAVGSVVPWAQADAGAVATQSYANTSFGPRGLEMMASGLSAQETLEKLLADDADRDLRQVGMVDAQGRAVTFTGSKCYDWAGGLSGSGYAIQGNILTGEGVVRAMEKTFRDTKGDLASRLHAALLAGDRAGGDRRGRQSAAVYVVKPKGGYGGYLLYFGKSAEGDRLPLAGEALKKIQQMLD